MAEGVLMPKEGITVESCIIGEWKKNVGDQVNVGDILFTYETDKAEFECESTAAGTLLEKFYEDGDEVPCLVNVCAIGNPGEDTSALKNAPAASAAPAAAAAEAPRRLLPLPQLLPAVPARGRYQPRKASRSSPASSASGRKTSVIPSMSAMSSSLTKPTRRSSIASPPQPARFLQNSMKTATRFRALQTSAPSAILAMRLSS